MCVYKPGQPPIQEESEIIQASAQSQAAAEPEEFLIRRQTLGDLLYSTPTTDAHEAHTGDEEQTYQRGSSGSTITTEFSRQFTFSAEAGGDDVAEQIHSAWWLQESRKQKDSRVDDVLVDTLPPFTAAEHRETQPDDDLDELQQGADALTDDIFSVAVQRVRRAEPAPLTQSAIRSAQVITLDILHRAMRDDLRHLQTGYSSSKCGPRQTKLASTIVQRVMDLASGMDSKWSKEALQATSLLVQDVFSSAVSHRDDWSVEPDHTWSRQALQASCLIIRNVMTDAARQAAMDNRLKQQQSQSQPQTSSQDRDLVNSEFTAAVQHDIVNQDDPAEFLIRRQTLGEPFYSTPTTDAHEAHTDDADQTFQTSQYDPHDSAGVAASPPVDDVPCQYENESVFNDSRTSPLSMLDLSV